MAHGKWTEVEARAALATWSRSGLSIAEFAKRNNIVVQRLYWWRSRLRIERVDEAKSAETIELLPVQVAETKPKRGEPVLVLLRSGHMLKVARGFDEEAFSRVVAVLEAC